MRGVGAELDFGGDGVLPTGPLPEGAGNGLSRCENVSGSPLGPSEDGGLFHVLPLEIPLLTNPCRIVLLYYYNVPFSRPQLWCAASSAA